MRKDDGRKLDHRTLEAIRIRAVGGVKAGERPEVVAKTLGMRDPVALHRRALG